MLDRISVSDIDELRYNEDHFRHAIELNPQMLWTASRTGRVDAANLRWRELVGVSPGNPVDDGWSRSVHPDDLPGTIAAWSVCLRTGEHLDHEYRLRLADGNYRWFRARAVPRTAEDGRIIRWYGSLEDVHDAKMSLLALRESEQRLRHALAVGHLGAWDLDLTSRTCTISDICAGCFGWPRGGEMANFDATWLAAIHPDDREPFNEAFDGSLRSGAQWEIEYRAIWPDSSIHWIRSTARGVQDESGRISRMVGLVFDVTEQRRDAEQRMKAEAEAKHLAYHDALTGLANRRMFDDRLEQAIALATPNAPVALLSIDLDRFKAVNDTLGHAAGDKVLRIAGERLMHCVRSGDLVARYGGDEFVVLYDGFGTRAEINAVALRILDALAKPFDLDGHIAELGGSIGISVAPDDTDEVAQLWHNADTALYISKRGGRGRHQFFEPEMDARAPARQALNLSLRDALSRQEFTLAYQPIINLATGRAVSFEALLRWQSPTHGAVAPSEFIPLAEKTGWIVPIGRWALHEACHAAAGWPAEFRVAVNLSAVQFSAGGLADEVAQALASSGLEPHRLELEITETLLMHDSKAEIRMLEELRALGVRLALDDFGTGFSSLTYLRKFRFDMIKIEEALVSSMAGTEGEDSIVYAITDLGRSLGIATTAEGVETREQLDVVRAQGCTQAQGRYISPPLPGAEVAAQREHVWL
jgi:diguanylate cyclase (GGDEF)-like protein/PAS domain S-box-containing protein